MKTTSMVIVSCIVLSLAFLSGPVHGESWSRTYGGADGEWLFSARQTSNGGHIMAGYSSGAVTGNIWLLKLDADGTVVWQKAYGGSGEEYPDFVQQTAPDGGYIVAGGTTSFGEGNYDIWLLKLDADGNVTWQKTYGGTGADHLYSARQTADGGYIVAARTASFGEGLEDIWLLKLDQDGIVVWQQTYGGTGADHPYAVEQTPDGGYVVTGRTNSFGAGSYDIWVLKLDGEGKIEWEKTYGGTGADTADAIRRTADGGYIVAGSTSSFGAGSRDGWLLKLDNSGNVIWQKTYGETGGEQPYSVDQTTDGGYIVTSDTSSFGAGSYDTWIFKLNGNGNVMWQRTYGGTGADFAYSVEQTTEGGYIVTGETESFGAGSYDIWLLKLESNGSLTDCPLGKVTNATVTNTSVSGITSTAEVNTTAAAVADTNVTPVDTTISPAQICPAILNVLSPNGGENFITDSDWEIAWTPFIRASSFKAMYSLDNGATWDLIGKDITGTSTTWHTPLLTRNKTKCLVKVVGLNKKGEKIGSDKSDAPFKIEVLTILDINGGAACDAGQTCPITWELADAITPDEVQISYTLDGGTTWKKEDAVALPPVPIYNWTAPSVGRDRTCKVKLTLKAAGETVATATSIPFSINAP